jgi:hypothetical protein
VWRFETDPDCQEKLDCLSSFVKGEVEPPDNLGIEDANAALVVDLDRVILQQRPGNAAAAGRRGNTTVGKRSGATR